MADFYKFTLPFAKGAADVAESEKAYYDPTLHPRAPKGHPEGGKWVEKPGIMQPGERDTYQEPMIGSTEESDAEIADELEGIQDELRDIAERLRHYEHVTDEITSARIKGYIRGNLVGLIDDDNEFGGATITLADVIKKLRGLEE